MKALLFISLAIASPKVDVDHLILKYAKEYNVDPKLIRAIIKIESNFNPNSVGANGEIGLMQLDPKYHKASFDIEKNLKEGIVFLAEMQAEMKDEYGCAWFVANNIGVAKRVKHPMKLSYFKKVIKVYPDYCKTFRRNT